MAEAYTLSQEQYWVLEKAISSIVKNDGSGTSLSSEEFGIIKHIISPEDFEILRRNFAVMRNFYIDDEKYLLEFKFEALMRRIGNVFDHAFFRVKSASHENFRESNEKIDGSPRSFQGLEIDDNIQRTVCELYCKMVKRCANGVDDAHEVTLALLDSLRDYFCTAQVVLVVVAFAMSFGELGLTVEPLATDHLSQSICLLKLAHFSLNATDSVKSGLESLRTSVGRIWDSTNWFVNYEDILTRYPNTFPEASLIGYQVVYSVVTCLSHNIALVRMNKEYTNLATEFQRMRN